MSKKLDIPLKKELEEDVRTLSGQEIAEKYHTSLTVVTRWLRIYNLHRIHNNDEKNREEQNRGEETDKEAVSCGDTITEEPEAEYPLEEDYAKIYARFKNDFNTFSLDNARLIGIQLCPAGCRDGSRTAMAANITAVRNTIHKIWDGADDGEYHAYHTSPCRYYITLIGGDKDAVVDRLRKFKENLWKDEGVCIAYTLKTGTYYSSIGYMISDADRTLKTYKADTEAEAAAIEEVVDAADRSEPLMSAINTDSIELSTLPADAAEAPACAKKKSKRIGIAEGKFTVPSCIQEDAVQMASEDDEAESAAEAISEDIKNGLITDAAPDADEREQEDQNIVKEVYLVDSENVNASWKRLLDGNPEKKMMVFYTEHTPRLSYEDMAVILKHPDGITMEKVFPGDTGASALDFQLVSILGMLIAEMPDIMYTIVSRDNGYDPVIKYWNSKGYRTRRLSLVNRDLPGGMEALTTLSADEKERVIKGCINETEKMFHTPTPAVNRMEEPEEKAAGKKFDKIVFLQKILPKLDHDIYEKMIAILDGHDADDTRHIHADFVDIFGGANGERMYKKVKKNLEGYKAI